MSPAVSRRQAEASAVDLGVAWPAKLSLMELSINDVNACSLAFVLCLPGRHLKHSILLEA